MGAKGRANVAGMKVIRTSLGASVILDTGEPLPLRHIIGIGRNYAEHAKEQGAAVPDRPMIFTKNPASLCVSGDAIVIPKICQDRPQVDFEAELAVVLGPTAKRSTPIRDVSEAEAFDCVVGYACANDVSARWWQKEGSGGQFCRGKSFDTFCPIGPAITPASAVADPQSLRVICRVNGTVKQDAPTSQMMFGVATLIADLSRGTTLLPGTVILTGTPSGVGMSRTPPEFLKHGDSVEIEISGAGVSLGVLRNVVQEEGRIG